MRTWSRWRRSRVALLAVIATVAVTAGGPAGAGPPGAVPAPAFMPGGAAGVDGPWASVTLVTGDRVRVGAGREPQVRPGPGRQGVRFRRYTEQGDTYVVPADAAGLVAAGRLDRRLFNVTKLVQFGYDDRSRADLPLIADAGRPSRSATASARAAVTGEGVQVTRELPSIGAVAVRAGKAHAAAFWGRVRGSVPPGRVLRTLAGGLERIWLDGPVRAALDRSVPRIGAPSARLAGQTGAGTTVAERLKSALMGGATPTAGLTVHQQGAGRVDLARATTQTVSATPASLSQGIARWPHGDDQPVTRTVTYHNHGDHDVTLRLGFEIRDSDGNPPPAGMFAVSDPRVTVPAGGTAAVMVTTDTAVGGPDGTYGGMLAATGADGQTRVRTPIGVVREAESYDLTLTFIGHDGQPAVEAITRIVDIDHGGAFLPFDPSGTVVVRLPKGRYYFENTISTPPEAGALDPGEQRWYQTDTVEPELQIDRDATMVVDAREGEPLGLLVDQPTAQPGWATIDFVRATPWGGTGLGYTVPDFERMFVRPSRTAAPPDQFEFIVAGILAEPDQAGGFAGSPYQYHVAWWEAGRVPAELVRRFRDRDLAKVHTLVAASAVGKFGVKDVAGAPLPSTLTEFYGPGRWSGEFSQFAGQGQEESESYIAGLQRAYSPGSTTAQRWNQAVFGPAFPVLPGDPAAFAGRVGDRLRFDLPLFTDQPADHYGYSRADGDLVLYRNGRRLGASGVAGYGNFDVPGGPATYRLESEATRSGVSELSTRVSTAWTFRSDTDQGSELKPLPLLAVRFAPILDQHNRAPSGQTFDVPVYLQRNGDEEAPAVAGLTVEASYDDGRTWSPAPLTGSGDRRRAVVTHPRGPGFVSLRATAGDTDGNGVVQTIIRAYAIRAA